MGAINYGSNNIINLGLNINILENETRKLVDEEYQEENEETKQYYFDDIINENVNYSYEQCEEIINNLGYLEYYEITLKSGYYEGFYLDIKNNVCFYNNYDEKIEAQKELTKIKKALKEMILNCGIVNYNAWWVTSYKNKKETLKLLDEAIKKERALIKDTFTDKSINGEMWLKGIFTKTQLKEYNKKRGI